MELNELKIQLNTIVENSTEISSEKISTLLAAKTSSVIAKIKKSLWFEIIITILVFMLFLYESFYSQYWSLRIYFSVFSLICIPFLFFIILLLKKVNRLSDNVMPVKKNLEKIYSILKEYIKRGYQATMALLIICMFFSTTLGYIESKRNIIGDNFFNYSLSTPPYILLIFLIIYTALLLMAMHYFAKWYFKKLYGNYLNELQESLNELQE